MKYSKSMNEELKRVIRNYNSKISRLEKSDRELLLPEKVNLKIIKSRVVNKWDLNREIDKLTKFSERGIEDTITTKGGLEISKYQYEILKKEQNRLVSRLDRQIKRLGSIVPTTFGVKEDVSIAQMGTERLSNLKARRENIRKRKISSLNKEGLKELQSLIDKTIQKDRYLISEFKENYIDQMLSNLGYYIGYDSKKLEEMKDKLIKLPDKKFLELFNTEEAIRAIRDYYPESKKSSSQNEKAIRNLYDELYNNLDNILKEY